jgi:hypothetical protein
MREFFNSPHYRAMKETKKRKRSDSDILQMPK